MTLQVLTYFIILYHAYIRIRLILTSSVRQQRKTADNSNSIFCGHNNY